jgi:hypothetical protein
MVLNDIPPEYYISDVEVASYYKYIVEADVEAAGASGC